MENGKAGLTELKSLLKKNKEVMLGSNLIGSDFSFMRRSSRDLVFKIEPMMYYDFLTTEENAALSILFPLNDFLTSGTMPSIAMLDFEKPKLAGDEYFDYIDRVFKDLRSKKIRVASGHTGNYGNLGYGIAGSIALVGFKRPVFSYQRIRKDDAIYFVGDIEAESSYFRERGVRHRRIYDLSIERYVKELLKIRRSVHYVHDLSEGGLMRGLEELSELSHSGYNVVPGLIGKQAHKKVGYTSNPFTDSSAGCIVAAVSRTLKGEFETLLRKNSWTYMEIERVKKGVTLDGRDYDPSDSTVRLLTRSDTE